MAATSTIQFANLRISNEMPVELSSSTQLSEKDIAKIRNYWNRFVRLETKLISSETVLFKLRESHDNQELEEVELYATDNTLTKLQKQTIKVRGIKENILYLEREYERYLNSIGLCLRDEDMDETLYNFINLGVYYE